MIYQEIEQIFRRNGHVFFKGAFNMNLFAVRGDGRVSDAFDDTLFLVYTDNEGEIHIKFYECTVDPGIPWLISPMNPGGAAAIAPGQYRRVWKLGNFKGTDALRQIGNFRIFRDNDKNAMFNYNPKTIMPSPFTDGIFLHEHFQKPDVAIRVNDSSAGCVVLRSRKDHNQLMELLKLQAANGKGDTFTFTLFNQTDFNIYQNTNA